MFGGGVFEKKRDHKEIMLDVIAKSKKAKFERQKAKEDITNEFEKLDSNYSAILKMTSGFNRTDDQKYDDKKAERNDEFTKLMREMKFEGRVQPGQRQKSQKEIQEEEEKQRAELLK